jgi:hypothetical protein
LDPRAKSQIQNAVLALNLTENILDMGFWMSERPTGPELTLFQCYLHGFGVAKNNRKLLNISEKLQKMAQEKHRL